ncbi:phosphatase PAP2 family protein [Nitratireductor thuwali]|uniref:Phosphatidic acid phosphatase type 2/haloperoxidase domain-containing protein n=1 Tax=Nitratireductor thuwali TaxID=2267699 RepID=A0ABY5MKJ5_9HYPH|nr:hypothetical protein NTH_00852 [Nitratireductor thuwali]
MQDRSFTARMLTGLVRGARMGREQALPVALLAGFALGVYAFVAIADEMAEGEVRQIDQMLFLMMREPGNPAQPLGPPWVQEMALEITAIGGYSLIILTLAAVVGLFLVTRRYGPALYAVLSVGSGALLSQTLKGYFDRPRPDLVDHLDAVHTASFPSGHALVTMVAYLTLASLVIQFFEDRRVRAYVLAVAVFVALIVGLSRVYLGVHWPSDVAAGWALGAAWAAFSWLVMHVLRRWRMSAARDRAVGGLDA